MILTVSCSHYEPLYGPSHLDTKSQIAIGQIRDESVSGLGPILSQKLFRDFSNSDQARYVINGHLQDVSIVTSPVKPSASSTRAYKVRAKLRLKLQDLSSSKHVTATIREEADFLLASKESQDQVLNTEHHRTKALHELARVLADGIEEFVTDALDDGLVKGPVKKGEEP
jgi:hypothetical protein